MFFASNNTWEGIYLASWLYLVVPKVSIPFDASLETLAEVAPSQVLFCDGIADVRKCIKDIVMTFKSIAATYAELPYSITWMNYHFV